MNRYAKSRDANEADIVHALRAIPGVKVVYMDKYFDLLVGFRAHNIALEVKMPGKEKRKDQAEQRKWREEWPGQIQVVTNIDEALNCVLNCYR